MRVCASMEDKSIRKELRYTGYASELTQAARLSFFSWRTGWENQVRKPNWKA